MRPQTSEPTMAAADPSPYRSDLAYIHDAGFGDLARGAAETLLDALAEAGLRAGTVVDLGCGSGLLARPLCDAGYAVVGIDLSEAMLALARQHVPEGDFRQGSFVDADLPSCAAVAAIGEVLGYAFDAEHDVDALRTLFQRIFAALAPGGIFLFDLAGPDRAPPVPKQSFREGNGWAVLMDAWAEDDGRVLARRIVSFRRTDGDRYRRDEETHRLLLMDPGVVQADLQTAGFEVRRLDGYGGAPLLPGLVAFLAYKPHPPDV